MQLLHTAGRQLPITYYNTKGISRRALLTPNDESSQMSQALETAGFHVRTRWTPDCSTLLQLFFNCSTQIKLGRQFVSGCVAEWDSTFTTYVLRIQLTNLVGITSTRLSFVAALSFIRSETYNNFAFIHASLSELEWHQQWTIPEGAELYLLHHAKRMNAIMERLRTRTH